MKVRMNPRKLQLLSVGKGGEVAHWGIWLKERGLEYLNFFEELTINDLQGHSWFWRSQKCR